MKTRLFAILFILLFSLAQSQSDSTCRMKRFIGSVEVHLQRERQQYGSNTMTTVPNYSYDAADYIIPDDKRYFSSGNMRPGNGYGFALYGNLRLYKGLRLKFGIGFESYQSRTGLIDTFYVQSYSTHTGPGPYFVPEPLEKHVRNTDVTYTTQFVSIPLKLHYYFRVAKKVYVNAGMGATATLRSSQSVNVSSSDGYHFHTEKNNQGVGGFLEYSLGVNYFLTPKLSLSFDPFARGFGTRIFLIGGRFGFNF